MLTPEASGEVHPQADRSQPNYRSRILPQRSTNLCRHLKVRKVLQIAINIRLIPRYRTLLIDSWARLKTYLWQIVGNPLKHISQRDMLQIDRHVQKSFRNNEMDPRPQVVLPLLRLNYNQAAERMPLNCMGTIPFPAQLMVGARRISHGSTRKRLISMDAVPLVQTLEDSLRYQCSLLSRYYHSKCRPHPPTREGHRTRREDRLPRDRLQGSQNFHSACQLLKYQDLRPAHLPQSDQDQPWNHLQSQRQDFLLLRIWRDKSLLCPSYLLVQPSIHQTTSHETDTIPLQEASAPSPRRLAYLCRLREVEEALSTPKPAPTVLRVAVAHHQLQVMTHALLTGWLPNQCPRMPRLQYKCTLQDVFLAQKDHQNDLEAHLSLCMSRPELQ